MFRYDRECVLAGVPFGICPDLGQVGEGAFCWVGIVAIVMEGSVIMCRDAGWSRILRVFVGLVGSVAVFVMMTGCPPMLPPVSGDATAVGVQKIAGGFTSPVALTVAGDGTGRLFIVDQVGVIRIFDGTTVRAQAFLDLTDRVAVLSPNFDERGLLGLAFHPDYANNGLFYVYYVPRDGGNRTRLAEFSVSGDRDLAAADSERVVLEIEQPQNNHNGGQLAFGPDGYLYIGVGDGGGANDTADGHTPTIGNGQDKSTLLGKILRIDVAGDPYAIPADNPFVDDVDARDEIYAFGLRNPWRFSFDPATGRLFVGDVGQNLLEEVHIVSAGDNLGWNRREGTTCFNPNNPAQPLATCPPSGFEGEPLVDPIFEYGHVDADGNPFGLSVIGGFVYRGMALSGLQGQYLFADWSPGFLEGDGRLFRAWVGDDGAWAFEELRIENKSSGRIDRFILGLGQDASGELYVLTTANGGPVGQTGEVYKLVPTAGG